MTYRDDFAGVPDLPDADVALVRALTDAAQFAEDRLLTATASLHLRAARRITELASGPIRGPGGCIKCGRAFKQPRRGRKREQCYECRPSRAGRSIGDQKGRF